jgi:hypothetical protein
MLYHDKDAFDLWCEWAEKPVDSMLTIDAAIHDAVMTMPPEERRDRAKVNEAVRDGIALGPGVLLAPPTNMAFRGRPNKTLRRHQRRMLIGRPLPGVRFCRPTLVAVGRSQSRGEARSRQ